MSTEDYHHENDNEDELPNGNTTNTRQPFTRSEDLYDNLGDGGDFTRRRRSYDFDSPPPNYSNNGSLDMNSPYNDYNQHNGYSEPINNGYDSGRVPARAGNQNQSSSLPTIRNKHKKLPSDRLYQPRYLIERTEKREAKKQSEQIDYDTSFHANLPKNLQHVKSKFRNPDLIKKKLTPIQQPPVPDANFKARIPKDFEYVTSRYQDPNYMKSPRGQNEDEGHHEDAIFRARPPRQLEHVGPRHLNEEYFKKKEARDDSPDRHQTEFHARLPENLQHVQSRILDPQYQQKQPPPDYRENYDRSFKARLPRQLEHVQSKLLDPINRDKSRAAENTDEQQYYKPEFKARPPKNLQHVVQVGKDQEKAQSEKDSHSKNRGGKKTKPTVRYNMGGPPQRREKRIYDQKYFVKKTPRSPVEEDVFSHEFKARPPKELANVESRILDERYFRKKSPVLAPIKPEDELKPNFKAKPPKDLEYIQSRVYDPKYFQKSERSSPTQSPKTERKGPVAIIKVKPEKKFELRPPGNSYAERLAMKQAAEHEDYYQIWHKQFQSEVKRKVRAEPETPDENLSKTVIAVVEEDKRVKKFGKRNKQQVVKQPEPVEERPIKSEGHDGRKPRMPWLKKKKKPAATIDKDFFDKWINIPEDVLKLKGDNSRNSSSYRQNKSAPQVWTNDFNNQQYMGTPRRQEYVGHYGGY